MIHLRAESCSSLVPMINTLIYILCQPSESTSSPNGSSCLLSSQVASPLDFRAKFGTKSAGLRSPPPLTKDSSFSVSTDPFYFKQVPEEIIIPSYLCLRIFTPQLEYCNLCLLALPIEMAFVVMCHYCCFCQKPSKSRGSLD
jgi:hypothetical protein